MSCAVGKGRPLIELGENILEENIYPLMEHFRQLNSWHNSFKAEAARTCIDFPPVRKEGFPRPLFARKPYMNNAANFFCCINT